MIEGSKIPIILISGFLGSGKTSLIGRLLSNYSSKIKIAVVQNEFAASSIDGQILQGGDKSFTLRELNTGSIFCSCLFSHFKDVVVELASTSRVELIIVEATGIADPIGIAQLLEDEAVTRLCYLSRIVTLIDASRFLRGVSFIVGARHQVQVADMVFVSKVDLVDSQMRLDVECEVRKINPMVEILSGDYSDIDLRAMIEEPSEPLALRQGIAGELTRCGTGGYISKIFKTTAPISRANLERFLASLGDEILRLKGFVRDEHGVSYVVQYIPGKAEVIALTGDAIGNTELISIGYKAPNFNLLHGSQIGFEGGSWTLGVKK